LPLHDALPIYAATAAEIDRQVRDFLTRGESLYSVDVEALRVIEPDLIITQDLCQVCAASPDDLAAALASLPRRPGVLSLNPRSLADVWRDIIVVGEATGRADQAHELVIDLRRRVAAVERATAGVSARPRVVCLEWLDPLYVAGHWVPEMVAIAGGSDVLGQPGERAFRGSCGRSALLADGYGKGQCRGKACLALPSQSSTLLADDWTLATSRPSPPMAVKDQSEEDQGEAE